MSAAEPIGSAALKNVLAESAADLSQRRNDAPATPATPGGAVIRGRQIVIKIWGNFVRLTARLAKSRVWFDNFTFYLDFSAIFSQFAPSKPLHQGRHLGAHFHRRGAPYWLDLQRYATDLSTNQIYRELLKSAADKVHQFYSKLTR